MREARDRGGHERAELSRERSHRSRTGETGGRAQSPEVVVAGMLLPPTLNSQSQHRSDSALLAARPPSSCLRTPGRHLHLSLGRWYRPLCRDALRSGAATLRRAGELR